MNDLEKRQQLEQLLQAINHDLRTPVGNIRSASSILLQDLSDPLTDDQRTFIEIIDRSTIRLLDQSTRLMLFSQIAFTGAALEPTRLSELLANTKRTLKNSYEIEAVTLNSDGDPLVNCNAYILSATLAMLVVGDLKHQPKPGNSEPPTIQTDLKSDHLLFTVHSLMPAHEIGHSLVELTGEIVQMHGGTLELSERNARKQFQFSLPLSNNQPKR